jgi:hypothetical protein
MSVSSVRLDGAAAADPAHMIETPDTFAPVFQALKAERIDQILTKIVYEVDWGAKGKTTINVIAHVTNMHANIIGYLPVAGVSLGACRLSLGVLRLSLAAASLGACRMLGLPQLHTFTDLVSHASSVKTGFIEVMPLAVGALAYLSNYTPSLDLLVTDLKVSSDKLGVISEFCEQTVRSGLKEDEARYEELKPWARNVIKVAEKTYTFATEGAECIVTCAAWGDIAVGLGSLIASPYTGGTTVPYALTSIARGALALGASSLIELATEYDLKGKITSYFTSGDADYVKEADALLYKTVYMLYHGIEEFGAIYEALENES